MGSYARAQAAGGDDFPRLHICQRVHSPKHQQIVPGIAPPPILKQVAVGPAHAFSKLSLLCKPSAPLSHSCCAAASATRYARPGRPICKTVHNLTYPEAKSAQAGGDS